MRSRRPPNKALVTGGWVRCAHPPAAQRQGVGRARLADRVQSMDTA